MSRWERLDRCLRVRFCGGCERILPPDGCYEAFCPDCREKWNRAKTESCPRCLQSAAECTCLPGSLASQGVLALRKLIFYSSKRENEPQNKILYRIKHLRNQRMLFFLALELKPEVEQVLTVLGIGKPYRDVVLVWVPRGKSSWTAYGFDHAELLCRFLSGMTGIPCTCALGRRWRSREQKTLSRQKRIRNMRNAIYVKKEERVRGRCILLVDDIVTTGASMSAAAAALKGAGARCIVAFSLAQTPKEKIQSSSCIFPQSVV